MAAKPLATATPSPAPGRRGWPAWARPFWAWLCHHPFLLLEALLLFALVWGHIGAAVGVPYLFWVEEAWTQFLAGIGTTLLLANLCYVGYLLDKDADWMKAPAGRRPLLWYLTVTWLPLVCGGLLLRALVPAGGADSFARAFNAGTYGTFLAKHVPFVLGVATPTASKT